MSSGNPYSDLTAQLRDQAPGDQGLGRRLNELIAVYELVTTLNTARTLEDIIQVVLFTFLGQYPSLRGAVFLKTGSGWSLGKARGLRHTPDFSGLPLDDSWDSLPEYFQPQQQPEPAQLAAFCKGLGLDWVFPARNEGRLVGLIALGKPMQPKLDPDKACYLAMLARFGGMIIGNFIYRGDLENVNRQLRQNLFQLKTLYELTGSFARCFERQEVYQTLANNIMGQFSISRVCVLEHNGTCRIVLKKGLRLAIDELSDLVLPFGNWSPQPQTLSSIECPAISSFMREAKLQYAVPLASEGKTYAMLLLGARLDRRPLLQADFEFLLSLAQQAAIALESIQLQSQAAEKKRMERDLELSREIQQKLLPKQVPQLEGYELAAEMRPYYQVGGDFYDFIPLSDSHWSFCLADVSGKSLPASMIMSTAQAALRGLSAHPGLSPQEVMSKLNLHLCQSTLSNKFVTMFYGVLDLHTHRLTYINAGHNRPILMDAKGEVTLLDKGGMVLGLIPQAKYQVGEVEFLPGSDLLIFTDGFSEVMDAAEEEYGEERLADLLRETRANRDLLATKSEMVAQVMAFCENKMVDDLTLLMIRRR